MDEKGSITKSGHEVMGIQLRCRKHGWQRTIYIEKEQMTGCSKCYGGKTLTTNPPRN